jgi:Bacterial PH domain
VIREYYILKPDGIRDGPYAEEEVLDLLEGGGVTPDAPCLDASSGRVCEAGALFKVINPELEPASPPAPVPWQPAPFPESEGPPGASALPDKPPARLLYRGNPCFLTYWRSGLLASLLWSGGWLARDRFPALLPLCLAAGAVVLLAAVLRRLSRQYFISSARVEIVEGLLARSSRELRIADIRAINVTRKGPTGLLGIGTLGFSSAAGAPDDVVFQSVWRASSLKEMVRRIQDTDP